MIRIPKMNYINIAKIDLSTVFATKMNFPIPFSTQITFLFVERYTVKINIFHFFWKYDTICLWEFAKIHFLSVRKLFKGCG